MTVKCSKCGKEYNDIFDTIVRCDYVETGRGKPYEWHICINCRKNLIKWFEE